MGRYLARVEMRVWCDKIWMWEVEVGFVDRSLDVEGQRVRDVSECVLRGRPNAAQDGNRMNHCSGSAVRQ